MRAYFPLTFSITKFSAIKKIIINMSGLRWFCSGTSDTVLVPYRSFPHTFRQSCIRKEKKLIALCQCSIETKLIYMCVSSEQHQMMSNKDQPPPYSPPGSNTVPPPPGFYQAPYQPPLQPMNPPHPQPQTHVIINTANVAVFGPTPIDVVCPSCHIRIRTDVKTEPNTKTHLFALILCLFQCYCCCCIPYCVDSCQSQNHYCPNCGAFLGGFQN